MYKNRINEVIFRIIKHLAVIQGLFLGSVNLDLI